MNQEQQAQKTEKKSFESYKDLPNVVLAKGKLQSLLDNNLGVQDRFQRILYEMLTRRSEYVRDFEQAPGGTAEVMKNFEGQKAWYSDTLEEIGKWVNKQDGLLWESNPGWFGINTHSEASKREGVNIKAYATVPIKEYAFTQHLPKLVEKLRALSLGGGDIIQVKVPNTLTGFISNNDSIVIHFKNPENKEKILETLNAWMEENNITKSEREMGRTEIAADSKKSSFSDLVSENIAKWLAENSGKYPNDLLSEQAVKHAIEQSQIEPRI